MVEAAEILTHKKTLPELSALTQNGAVNVARVPTALLSPGTPLPANVVTTAPLVIVLIRAFPSSATIKLPEASNVIP
jgi:hypothetical protein